MSSSCVGEQSNPISPTSKSKPCRRILETELREASFEDYAGITALQSKYDLQTKSYEEWKHLWSGNPAYRENEHLPIGWVLIDKKQQVVGYLGNIPMFYELGQRRLLASAAHSWVAELEYRSYSPLLMERYFSQTVIDIFLNATVGSQSAQAFAAFHSVPIPVGIWDESAFWITNYHGFFANWLAAKKVPLANPLGYLLGGGLFLKDSLSRRQGRREQTLDVRECTCIDSRFDDFWQALRKTNSTVLMGVRSQQALQWHFGRALQQNKVWIVSACKGPNIVAYAIFQQQDSAKLRLRRMRLVDFQTLDGNTEILEPMLCWTLEKCQSEDIHMLECIGLSGKKREVINRTAPHIRKLPCWLYYYKTYEPELSKKLSDPNVWDPSQFDGDASL